MEYYYNYIEYKMPCGCRKCDCGDNYVCYYIEARLNSLACIFDRVSERTIGDNQPGLFTLPDNGNFVGCKNSDGNQITVADAYVLYNNIKLFNVTSDVTPADFLPSAELAVNGDFLQHVVCIPGFDGSSPCQTCISVNGFVQAACAVTSDFNDLSNYARLAQNLRIAARVLGCD